MKQRRCNLEFVNTYQHVEFTGQYLCFYNSSFDCLSYNFLNKYYGFQVLQKGPVEEGGGGGGGVVKLFVSRL